MNKTAKRIISFLVATVLTIAAIPAVYGESDYVMLKSSSSLTIDEFGSGYIRGIWGTTTAGQLMGQFDGGVSVRRGGKALGTGEAVASDDVVYAARESFPVIIYGDCSRDGKVTLDDVTAMLMTVAKWNKDICVAAADVNMNGKCDLADITEILKWIAGWDITLADSVFPEKDIKLGGFTIVIPDDADDFERMAADYLADVLDTVYGKRTTSDRVIYDTSSATLEILVGNTSRSRSAKLKEKLSDYGWGYDIPTDKTVVIAGGDTVATYEAAKAFVWDNLGYIDENNTVGSYYSAERNMTVTTSSTLTTGKSRIYEHKPSAEELTFNGNPVSEYKIVSRFRNDSSTELVQRALLRETGVMPEVVDKYGDTPEIRIGVGNRKNEFSKGLTNNVFAIGMDGDDVIIDVYGHGTVMAAALAFVKWCVEERIPMKDGVLYYGGMGSNLLYETGSKDTVVSDGITYSAITYHDERDQPVLAYLVTVENGADHIIMGTPDNGTAVSGVKATVLDAIKAAEKDGSDIAAGINADFFDMGGTYSPNGICVKDGVIMKNQSTNPWIAVMKDGTMDCGIAGEARSKIGNMKNAFGASHVLMKNGTEYQTEPKVAFAQIRHPRTAMGYDSDGTVYLLVVDGRRPMLSNGASLLDLMLILRNNGAEFAVNLDGGGSSTMIVDENGFVTKNSPSDGALRKIFNSVLIVK